MTNDEKVTIIRGMAKGAETLDDNVIESYLISAKDAILNRLYPFRNVSGMEVPSRYDSAQIRIAIYNIHKRGAEGETKHIEVGTERDFASADIPADLLSELVPLCGVPR